ncbi:hypothetical protein FOA52_002916 [Chlamydomonas sp. UWO 241]|nr:hypothetical protein FOA52_002916 [Chlamydomonas sp. UWO 241]
MASSGSPSTPSSQDLLVVGPGVLGGYLGKLWKEAHPGATVVGMTNTTTSHGRLKELGLEPATRDTLPARKFPYVAFCAPPSGSQDYPADVGAAARDMWDGTGSFVFTSSMSVCSAENGETVTDADCPLVPLGKGPGTDKMLGAESAVLGVGGNVLRLVGLYHAGRGAHTFFLKAKEVARWGGYVVNLCHYEDAAALAAAVLRGDGEGPFRGEAFIGCDNTPVTFADMIVACNTSGVPVLQGEVKWTLPEEQASKGKRVLNDGTRKRLGGWVPKYPSFAEFCASGAKDFYTA